MLIDKGADKNKPNVTSPHPISPLQTTPTRLKYIQFCISKKLVMCLAHSLELNHRNEPGDILLIVGR